jgi:ketosteroid isomerase-like protein
MTMKSPSAIVRSFWSAFAAREFDRLVRDLVAPECVFVMPGAPPLEGAAAIRGMFESYARAFPDFECTPVHGIEQGDTFAGEARYGGTHRAALVTPLGEIAPTGRAVSWQSADIVRVSAGRIVSWHVDHDTVAVMAQLGVPMG